MIEPHQVSFDLDGGRLLLPATCVITAPCLPVREQRWATEQVLEGFVRQLAEIGYDLRSLDGFTLAHDCRATGNAMQYIPEGQVPLEMADQPDTMELARTVPVWREGVLRFHVVLRAGIGLMLFSEQEEMRQLSFASIAHEAAHVDHEGHLYRTFPDLYGKSFECGDRSRQTLLKAIDVWSEYSACRSSASFRPKALEDFESVFCSSLGNSLSASKELIAAFRQDEKGVEVFTGIQQVFGDLFITAGYLLGHMAGLELKIEHDTPLVSSLFKQHRQTGSIFANLQLELNRLWLTEYGWETIEVFTPIYDSIRQMMGLCGFVFAKNDREWRIVMCEDDMDGEALRQRLSAWMSDSDQ
jgi:hypothetical protein